LPVFHEIFRLTATVYSRVLQMELRVVKYSASCRTLARSGVRVFLLPSAGVLYSSTVT
jgi:hypothetical protein